MADVNEKVMSMVRDELEKNPKIKTDELFDKAKKIDKSISNLTIRQFHARYPLQVKRQLAAARGGRRRRAAGRRRTAGVDREAVRTTLLQFAQDIAGAEDKAAVVNVVAGVDKYVDRVLKAAGRG